MPKLYVANVSKQHHIFTYRTPESRHAPIMIPIGQQREITGKHGELGHDDIALILKDKAPYGLVDIKEIKNRREFTGLCYSIGDPVKVDTFYEGLEQNDKALDERSAEIREEAASAIATQMEETLRTPVKRTEVELVEQTAGTPKIAEGTEVLGDGTAARHVPTRKARRG